MVKPEIPSIVVHNGFTSAPEGGSTEVFSIDNRSLNLSSLTGDDDLDEELTISDEDKVITSPVQSPSLPLTPSSPSPVVSSASPSVSSSPIHLKSSIPTSLVSVPIPAISQGIGSATTVIVQEPSAEEMTVGPADPQGLAGMHSRSLDLSCQRSTDTEKIDSSCTSSRHRSLHGNKLKLLQRSHAMREATSPPPAMDIMESIPNSNNLTVCQGLSMGYPSGANRRRLRHQGSSGGSFDGSSPCLSRDSSTEYTDNSGVDLQQFIIQTLHKNQKDRMLLLKIEKELINLVKDLKRSHHKFPQMSSYQRMLVHRCAAFFGLDHNVDHVGTCVIVNKTRSTRLPEIRFKDHIRDELLPPDEPKRSILRRGYNSYEDPNFRLSDRLHTIESRRSKSFEEREEEYEKSFSSMDEDGRGRYPFDRHFRRNSHDESRWPDSRHFPDLDSKYYDNHRFRQNRMHKGESFESHDSLNVRSLRPPVFKSNSFGGYSGGVTVLARGDSCASNPSRLSKQDSTCSRFSDHSSSSGYKTQRQDTSSTNVSNTLSTTPSPTASQYQHHCFGQQPHVSQHSALWSNDGETQPVMWAVTDMEAVPSGAMLINPQSGQPFINSDGSIYRYDPINPPNVATNLCTHHKKDSIHDNRSSLQVSTRSSFDHDDYSGAVPLCDKNDRLKHVISRTSDDIESSHVHTYSSHQCIPSTHRESRPYSKESISEIASQFRSLSMPGTGNETPSEVIPPTASATPIPHSYVIPRQQYPQTMYYVPPTSVANLSGGGLKYVYPPYQMVGSQGAPPIPSTSHHTPVMPTAVQHISQPINLPPVPQAIAEHPPTHTQDSNAAITPGFIPSNYAVVAYNPNGLLNAGVNSGNVQESGGTTYYPIPGTNGLPPTAAGSSSASAPTTSLQQYALNPTTTTTSSYPMALNLYSSNGMYQPSAGIQGYPGNIYAHQPHSAALTPPQSSNTQQGMGIPIGFNSAGAVAPSGSQYIVLPSQQPPTPTTHAPHVFQTFFRPSLQAVWREHGEETFDRVPRS